MNFFNSVFSDDPDPPKPESGSENADPDPGSGSASDRWRNFGGLIKNLTAKSESIIETYRRDLQEFSTGLKSEIEVAQGSVGHVIDEFGNTVIKGTAQIISQGKDAILALDSDSDNGGRGTPGGENGSGSSKRYNRFDAQVRAIQGDASTYTDAPEDLSAFDKWKSEFSLEGKRDEMEGFFRENEAMQSVYKRVVPNAIDHETFWYRYYFKVYRLKKAEDVRARLVGRISTEEEELSWDFEDVDDEDEKAYGGGAAKPEVMINKDVGDENEEKKVDTQLQIGSSGATNNEGQAKRTSVEAVKHSGEEETKVEGKDNLLQSNEIGNEMEKSVPESRDEKPEVVNEMGGGSKEAAVDKASKSPPVGDGASKNDSAAESDGKVVKEMESGDGKSSSKNNESSVVESPHSANVEEEEEDLGWDEIEDLSSVDEKKATQSGSTSQVDLRKRLSAAEDDEDLSWDIEDDDEPAKA